MPPLVGSPASQTGINLKNENVRLLMVPSIEYDDEFSELEPGQFYTLDDSSKEASAEFELFKNQDTEDKEVLIEYEGAVPSKCTVLFGLAGAKDECQELKSLAITNSCQVTTHLRDKKLWQSVLIVNKVDRTDWPLLQACLSSMTLHLGTDLNEVSVKKPKLNPAEKLPAPPSSS
jgi:hypothetical protein